MSTAQELFVSIVGTDPPMQGLAGGTYCSVILLESRPSRGLSVTARRR